jgi:hypothetical protein
MAKAGYSQSSYPENIKIRINYKDGRKLNFCGMCRRLLISSGVMHDGPIPNSYLYYRVAVLFEFW